MRETLVVSHVTLVMSSLVVTLGPVSVTVVGVVLKPRAQKVCIVDFITMLMCICTYMEDIILQWLHNQLFSKSFASI